MGYAEELEIVRNNNGGTLRPSDVVEFAKNPETALHSYFEWDDTEAARQHRLSQARYIIRVVVIERQQSDPPVRRYVSLVPDRKPGNGYRTIDQVLASDDYKAQMLQQAELDMMRFQHKYATLAQLAASTESLLQTIKQARQEISDRRQRNKQRAVPA